MRSTSMTTPMLTLPHDALSEIALRLPAVKSTKPWRDLNSLATTCKGLYEWKKTEVDKYLEAEWKRVSAEVPQTYGWRDSLEKILSDFEHPSRRLFREPVLRKITKAEKKTTTAKPITSVNDFNVSLYKKRETASLNEISWCLIVCSHKKLKINKKIELMAKLPSFLTELKSIDRQTALRMMFKLLDVDKKLSHALKHNDTFDKIEKTLVNDHLTKSLLELGLNSRELLTRDPKEEVVKLGLNLISDENRWKWILKNVPECLSTPLGGRIMITDPACQLQLINFINKSFSKCATDVDRIKVCQPIPEIYSMLDQTINGTNLINKINKWFADVRINLNSNNTATNHGYVKLLCMQLDRISMELNSIKTYQFRDRLIYVINFFVTESKEFEQSTQLLIAVAKNNFAYWFQMHKSINNKDALKHALLYANNLPNLIMQYRYVSVLKKAAQKYFKADLNLIAEMKATKNAIKKSIAVAKSKH